MTKAEAIRMEKIMPALEEIVEQKLVELLGNPDSDLQLKTEVKRRLKKSLAGKMKSVSAKKTAAELGLKW